MASPAGSESPGPGIDPSPPEGLPARPNFSAAEFNTVDDLDDNIGNYRNFQSLEGVVTADMRFHEKRRKREQEKLSAPPDRKPDSGEVSAEKRSTPETTDLQAPLTIISKGRTLVIGPRYQEAQACAARLEAAGLDCTVAVTTSEESTTTNFRPFTSLSGPPTGTVVVSGSFGGFRASITPRRHHPASPGRAENKECTCVDLVLDLQTVSSYDGALVPLGYFAVGTGTVELEQALTELPELRGHFQKPRFTRWHHSRCLHGRAPFLDCRECLDTCPVEAIQATDSTIVIDPYLCQGCGSCALVCRAEAIDMQAPTNDDLVQEMEMLLAGVRDGDSPPPLFIFGDTLTLERLPAVDETGSDTEIVMVVEEIGRVGADLLLAALVRGAGSVQLRCGAGAAEPVRKVLQEQFALARAILAGLGLPTGLLEFEVVENSPRSAVDTPPGVTAEEGGGEPLLDSTVYHPGQQRRMLLRRAAKALAVATGSRRRFIAVPPGAPFGTVRIAAQSCTLCMACVGSCPSGALATDGRSPSISFIESRCHQCGLCAAACPESAIELERRLAVGEAIVDSGVILHESKTVCCRVCGTPFTSAAMLRRLQTKLAGHWMYRSDDQLQRLEMCRTCSSREAITSGGYRL